MINNLTRIILFTGSWLLFTCDPTLVVREKAPPTTAAATYATTDYYISGSGSDANDGRTPATAWRSVAKLNALVLQPGVHIFLEAGKTFSGNVLLTGTTSNTPEHPVVLTTYNGTARATLIGNNQADGIQVVDLPGIAISNLAVKNFSALGTRAGISVRVRNSTVPVRNTRLQNLEVSGWGAGGVTLVAEGAVGLSGVRIQDCLVHHNGEAGIFSCTLKWPQIPHQKFTVKNTKAYYNGGTGVPDRNTGSGILLSGVDSALVDHCEAYENGRNNGHRGGGPMGIWCYDARNVTMQYSLSHHNRMSQDADGGGFDIDGGSEDCIIQYSFSYENEGEGFGLFEYGSPNPFRNNQIRWNVSYNDGRKNKAAFMFWCNTGSTMQNSYCYNNSAYGVPHAYEFIAGATPQNVVIANNLISPTSAPIVGSPAGYTLRNNVTGVVSWKSDFWLPATSPYRTGGIVLPLNMGLTTYHGLPLKAELPIGAEYSR